MYPQNELEISSINMMFLDESKLNVEIMEELAWLDTGTFESLLEAGEYVRSLERRQGLKIGAIEEVAWRNGWINDNQLKKIANSSLKSGYGKYLLEVIENKYIQNHKKLIS